MRTTVKRTLGTASRWAQNRNNVASAVMIGVFCAVTAFIVLAGMSVVAAATWELGFVVMRLTILGALLWLACKVAIRAALDGVGPAEGFLRVAGF
jgi:hypothetical protein